MIGNHAIPVIVDVYLKDFRGFNSEEAYEAVKTSLTTDHQKCSWQVYDKYGYYPFDIIPAFWINNSKLFDIISNSGITDVWLIGYINGYRYYPVERIKFCRSRFFEKRCRCHIIQIPLGHPVGLAASSGSTSLGIEGKIHNITPGTGRKKQP